MALAPLTPTARGYVAAQPHHDGSELYVSCLTPRLEEHVAVRVRVPLAFPEKSVHLRTVRDGEPRISPAHLVATTAHDRWYEAHLYVHNPVTSYRFFFELDGDYAWLNGEGLHYSDVADASDFRVTIHQPAPQWLHNGIVYQIFPDRFARSSTAPALPQSDIPDWAIPAHDWNEDPIPSGEGVGAHYFGGDLDGISEHLDYLKELGVGTVYLTPVFPGRSNHRYDASTFDEVDPVLGGNDAYARLSTAVHERGMRLMGDITSNHTGATHDWFTTAVADPSSEEHSYFYWTDDEIGYASWLEHASLPKLNYNSHALRERMIEGENSVIGQWLKAPFNLDGWRVDVANMTGRWGSDDMTHEVARTIRNTMCEINPDALLIAEHFHDASLDLDGDGWHGNMNYSAFTRPVWSWLADQSRAVPAFGLPASLARRSGQDMAATMRRFSSVVPYKVNRDHWNMLGSHDTPRLRTLVGDAMVEVALGMLVTYLGNPVVFAGDEVGLTGDNGEHARKTMPWNDPTRWDEHTHQLYTSLIAVRSHSEALRLGGLRWVMTSDDAVAYVRETPAQTVLVLLARAGFNGGELDLSIAAGPAGENSQPLDQPEVLYGTQGVVVNQGRLVLPQVDTGVHIWRLR